MKLEVGKFYKTRKGEIVHIFKKRTYSDYPFEGKLIPDNIDDRWTESGHFLGIKPSSSDLVEELLEVELVKLLFG